MELNINKIAPTYKPTVSNNYRSINKIITLFGEVIFLKISMIRQEEHIPKLQLQACHIYP